MTNKEMLNKVLDYVEKLYFEVGFQLADCIQLAKEYLDNISYKYP